ncbi:hypothetical protein QQ055_00330 [Geitlerinema calcuttense NRMC-F 0142]|uniref:Uncharacterized protein n=1 Tax=Geitlerinema calcuttense NRMC-F 0142 TaxID=2922238 RepID=A0ABT7LX34_9CYAN|nr:hypothetical protein [Geitlerinema calcuttense NRMC-F 0142]
MAFWWTQKTVIGTVLKCMKGTIQHIATVTDANGLNSSALVKPLCLGRWRQTPSLFGESILTMELMSEPENDSKASTVRFSGTRTRQNISAQTLSERLTPLLISRGLVRGIIPTSMRKRSGQRMLDGVLSVPDGENADTQKAVC